MPVYFAQAVSGGPIKIGYSNDVEIRIKQLEKHYGRPLAVLATHPGGVDEEYSIHQKFSHLRLKGVRNRGRQIEQFRPAADLMEFIGRPLLVSPNPDAVEIMDSFSPHDLNYITAKIERSLIEQARIVAMRRRIALAEYLSDLIRGPVGKDYSKAVRDMGVGMKDQ